MVNLLKNDYVVNKFTYIKSHIFLYIQYGYATITLY
jgi:hypothetical protein